MYIYLILIYILATIRTRQKYKLILQRFNIRAVPSPSCNNTTDYVF